MSEIVLNKIIDHDVKEMIPKILPNNLGHIKDSFGLSAQDIAKALNLNVNFVNNVINQKVNFSSLSVVKLLKQLHIPFSLLYNVKREVETPASCSSKFFCIYRIDKNSKIENNQIIADCIDKLNLSSDSKDKVLKLFKKVTTKNITYSDAEIEENLLYDLEKCTHLVDSVQYDFDNYIYYCMLIEDMTSSNVIKKYIDLHERYDQDLIEYLYSLPFNEVKLKKESISIFKVKFIENTNEYLLPNTFKLLLDNKIVETDKICKKDCLKIHKNEIIIPVAVTENKLVKLKELREFKKYSVKDMAKILDMSEKTYINIENGYQRPSISTMWRLEYFFGILLDCVINIDEFYERYCI